MPKSKSHSSFDTKTFVIVLVSVLVLALCLAFAMELIYSNSSNFSVNGSSDDAGNGNNSNDSLAFRVVDGDTIELYSGEVIRLLCVNTPEVGKEGYEEAGNYLSSLLLSSGNGYGDGDIRLERQGLDKYNRTLAWIYLSNSSGYSNVSGNGSEILINKEIVDNGYGDLFPYDGTDCGRMK